MKYFYSFFWHYLSILLLFFCEAAQYECSYRRTAHHATGTIHQIHITFTAITSLDLNETSDDGVLGWQRHQLDHMQTICTSLQTDNHTNTSSLNFYRPDALPDAQPTASVHENEQKALT